MPGKTFAWAIRNPIQSKLERGLELFNCLVDSEGRDIPDLKSCADHWEKAFQMHFEVMVSLEASLVN